MDTTENAVIVPPNHLHRQDGKLIAWFNAGGWQVFPGMTDRTWNEWIDELVVPLYEQGVRRFWLHNPMGQWGDKVDEKRPYLDPEVSGMMFKQALVSRRHGINDVDGFADAWAPFIEAGCEVIAYVGAPDTEDNTVNMINALEPFLACGATIGLDATSPAEADSATWEKVLHLRYDLGARVILEALPRKENEHHKGHNACCIYRFWRRNILNEDRRDLYWTPTERRADGGESIVIAHAHEWPDFDTVQDEINHARLIMQDGYTPCSKFWQPDKNPETMERLQAWLAAFQP